jgi:hypothetical protein
VHRKQTGGSTRDPQGDGLGGDVSYSVGGASGKSPDGEELGESVAGL